MDQCDLLEMSHDTADACYSTRHLNRPAVKILQKIWWILVNPGPYKNRYPNPVLVEKTSSKMIVIRFEPEGLAYGG